MPLKRIDRSGLEMVSIDYYKEMDAIRGWSDGHVKI